MITGVVTARREAVVALEVLAPNGVSRTLDAVVDTGFNGFIALPAEVVASLGFVRKGSAVATLGDGSEALIPLYRAAILWDGQMKRVEAFSVDSAAMVGMALLSGFTLFIEVERGGRVEIERCKKQPG